MFVFCLHFHEELNGDRDMKFRDESRLIGRNFKDESRFKITRRESLRP